jgi:hypothetical protein
MARTTETVRSILLALFHRSTTKLTSRSGPSKEYNESLEQRLQLTESVLLSLMSILPDIQLATLPVHVFEVPEPDVALSPAEKKARLEEWNTFPLRSVEDLFAWRHERFQISGGGKHGNEAFSASDALAMEDTNMGSSDPDSTSTETIAPPTLSSKGPVLNSGLSKSDRSIGLSKDFQDSFLW